jgi:hypothetical protein
VEEELGYFERNIQRMQYGSFRAADYFIGSGVVEAGCKTVIGARCKQSGMFWSIPGAENVLALRCIHSSWRLDPFWKHRINQHAKRNDTLSLSAGRRILSAARVAHPKISAWQVARGFAQINRVRFHETTGQRKI